ncbi:uncharacterized protein CDAR_254031 [Caerostris darwini]|uniref:Toll-like receptor 2 n=1 Tax=Caerostris darwini TaxID=1538125 RepID=A0AAV4S851_9ARAC|nr:uncharacterized protein CDAR_254031 [Caerostris darwini]
MSNLFIEKCEELLPECECKYSDIYWKSATLTCYDVSDFEAFNDILRNIPVFEGRLYFSITLYGNAVLPKGFLSRLFVSDLTVDDFQTQRVEEGAFDGVLYLRQITLRKSSMKEIPDFRAIRHSLQILQLDNSRLTQLQGDNLKNLTCLWKLSFVNNSIAHVAEDVFQVRTPLPPPVSSFSFCLEASKLPSALSCAFSSVPTMQTDLPPPLCRLHKLIFLLLVCCTDSFYPSLLIENRGTEGVKDFDISHNLLTFLPPRLFKSCRGLREVRLSYNQLLHVDHLFFGTNLEVKKSIASTRFPNSWEPRFL